jgi:hypothetical protein
LGAIALFAGAKDDPWHYEIRVPKLARAPRIDGDLSEWKYVAFSDGVWDIFRLRNSPWFDPRVNRLTDHGGEPAPEDDLSARYYTAWDDGNLYLGAEVRDNVNDVDDRQHEPKRWYFKDAICWFIEAPREAVAKKFGQGDNAFCFVIDTRRPPYGAWWRHGAPGKTYVEEPLTAAVYSIRMGARGDFVLEARVPMGVTLGKSDPRWAPPKPGDMYGIEIVHTDPDGGDYGGHFILYGKGDDDSTWSPMILTGPIEAPERKPK